MNNYGVKVNYHSERAVQGSSSRVAISKALRWYKESEFKPSATIVVRFISKVEYCFDIVAYMPKRETVQQGWPDKATADAAAERLKAEHNDWHLVRAVRRQKK